VPVHPRPSDLVALVACLPPAAIVLTFDVETCADPAGGDARVAGRARVVQLGIAAFSGEPLPGCGDPVHLPPGATTHELAPAPLRYVHRSDASDADLLAAFTEADEPAAADPADPATATPAAPAVAGYVFSDVVMVNPGCRIDPASQAIHRITDAQVRQGPGLAAIADELLLWLTGADPETGVAERAVYLCGYNALRYDVPVLAADLRRVGRGDVADVLLRTRMLDAMLIRKAADPPMTLAGTALRYGLGGLEGAHTADADSLATLAVLAAQAACGHIPDLEAALSLGTARAAPAGAVDSQGKLKWLDGKTADKPTPDNILVEFGKHKGKSLRVAGANYCKWICGGDFPDDVKNPIRLAWGPAAAKW